MIRSKLKKFVFKLALAFSFYLSVYLTSTSTETPPEPEISTVQVVSETTTPLNPVLKNVNQVRIGFIKRRLRFLEKRKKKSKKTLKDTYRQIRFLQKELKKLEDMNTTPPSLDLKHDSTE